MVDGKQKERPEGPVVPASASPDGSPNDFTLFQQVWPPKAYSLPKGPQPWTKPSTYEPLQYNLDPNYNSHSKKEKVYAHWSWEGRGQYSTPLAYQKCFSDFSDAT